MHKLTTRVFYGGVGSILIESIPVLAKANGERLATAAEALALVPDVSQIVVAEHVSGALVHPRAIANGTEMPNAIPVMLVKECKS